MEGEERVEVEEGEGGGGVEGEGGGDREREDKMVFMLNPLNTSSYDVCQLGLNYDSWVMVSY